MQLEQQSKLWNTILYLKIADELLEDQADLRSFGLLDEEVDGYADFFYKNYFQQNIEEI